MKKSFDKEIILPHPVFMVGTYDEYGESDVMCAAWGGQAGSNQVYICLSPHRTTSNIKKTKAFTISFATVAEAAACDYLGMVSKDLVEDKLERCGFTVTKSDVVNAPLIDQLPVAIECRVVSIAEEFDFVRVVGEIVGTKADESVITAGKLDYNKLQPIVFDSENSCYRAVGEMIGLAWNIGSVYE